MGRYYTHGGFMGLAVPFSADPEWMARLEDLSPAVHARVLELRRQPRFSKQLMGLLENDPVLAAYGVAQEPDGGFCAIEWDVWLDPAAPTDAEKMAISHGGPIDYVYEHVFGWHVFPGGALGPREWLRRFGRALDAEGDGEDDWKAAFARACPGLPALSIVLDVKTFCGSAAVAAVVLKMNEMGVRVEAVGSFERETVSGVAFMGNQAVGEARFPPPRQLWFHHLVGDVQYVCERGWTQPGDELLFNAGSIPPERNDAALVAELGRLKKRFGLRLGLYTQESDVGAAVAARLLALADEHAEVFDLGFAWGGAAGGALETDAAADATGLALQQLAGRPFLWGAVSRELW